VVVLGPLSITILSAMPTYQAADDSAAIAAKVARAPDGPDVALLLALIATMTLVPEVITIGLLAARHAPDSVPGGMVPAVVGLSPSLGVACHPLHPRWPARDRVSGSTPPPGRWRS
jgi:hypothetical protein